MYGMWIGNWGLQYRICRQTCAMVIVTITLVRMVSKSYDKTLREQ